MRLAEALQHAGRYGVSPRYTLFATDRRGNYRHVLTTRHVGAIVDTFATLASSLDTVGIEVRCEGMRVEFTGV